MIRILAILFILFPLNCCAAGGAQLTGIKGTLQQIEKSIYSAISKAEELYEQNGGNDLSSILDLLDSSSNPFINLLQIHTDYSVRIQFQGTSGSIFSSAAPEMSGIPIAQVMFGKKIKLFPIFVGGESRINSWECVTNVDKDAKPYMGSQPTTIIGNTSLISLNGNSGKNEYLSNCVYIDDLDLF